MVECRVLFNSIPQYWSDVMAVNFIGVGNRNNRRKLPTWRKSRTNVFTFMVFNATFNSISMEDTGVVGENLRPATSHWQTVSRNVVSSTPRLRWGSNSQRKWWLTRDLDTDRHNKFHCNYHTIAAQTTILWKQIWMPK
jgi:hypothetical protein